MKTCRFRFFVTLLVSTAIAAPATADVTVAPDEIVDGSYVYEIEFSDIVGSTFGGGPATALTEVISSHSGMAQVQNFFGTGVSFVYAAPGGTSAQFTFRWDFSGTSFRPTGGCFEDIVGFFTNIEAELTRADVSWSTNGIDFTTHLSVETVPDTTTLFHQTTPIDFGLAATEVFYRVEFTILPGNNNGVFGIWANQWGRSSADGSIPTTIGPAMFAATFREIVCEADLDWSGQIGFEDLLALLASWGPCTSCPEDIDGSGVVGFNDLVTLLAAWGPCE